MMKEENIKGEPIDDICNIPDEVVIEQNYKSQSANENSTSPEKKSPSTPETRRVAAVVPSEMDKPPTDDTDSDASTQFSPESFTSGVGNRKSTITNPQLYLFTENVHNTKMALHNFFFTEEVQLTVEQERKNKKVEKFWRAYDDFIILSLATQFGILIRVLSSFSLQESSTFNQNSALFTNLPTNILSCFIMGILCNGDEAMRLVRRGSKEDEHRTVQVDAMEARMRRSDVSIVLFMAKREEGDFMVHYEDDLDLEVEGENIRGKEGGLRRRRLNLEKNEETVGNASSPSIIRASNSIDGLAEMRSKSTFKPVRDFDDVDTQSPAGVSSVNHPDSPQNGNALNTLYSISHGWDVNSNPNAMSRDLLLGLRVGFCGALSSFSSWNSDMVNLIRAGQYGQASMGYTIGVALPLLAYRAGAQIAVYIFVWRCQTQAKREVRRNYYSHAPNEEEEDDIPLSSEDDIPVDTTRPSVRAFATALFIMALITQVTSLLIFTSPSEQLFAYSLLFSPLGVLARWKLNKWNRWLPSFPMGTFMANILSCALSGSLGSFLAGNPGDEERIVLQSLISGFAGSLSSLATFVIQVLDGFDPILLRLDGTAYACVTIFWGAVVGMVMGQAKNWADNL